MSGLSELDPPHNDESDARTAAEAAADQPRPASADSLPWTIREAAGPSSEPAVERPLFASWSQEEIHAPARIPHVGHLILLGVLAFVSLIGVSLAARGAVHFRVFGVSTITQAMSDVHYMLGSMAALYLLTFVLGLVVFPLFWQKSLLAGLQWRARTALHLRRRLFGAACVCFVLAIVNGILLPGPPDTPIDKIFRAPGAAWLMFVFGVTFAPFFEEIAFRGFLLPAVCTAYDWAAERVSGEPSRGSDENGHPLWSIPAMIAGSLVTSIPFAWMHGEQTSYALGPLLLLVCVSLVLCWARLSTRSLAASVLVHACYNFLLFFFMLLGTSGFRHLDKM